MCSVAGCNSSRRSAQLFKLPEDPEERLEWVMFIAEVNKQCFKESSWTDISVCSEHFPDDCLVTVDDRVQLKPSAVPSLCLNMGAEESSEWEAPTEDATSSIVSEVPQIDAVLDEESDPKDGSVESSDSGEMDSDEDWKPARGVFPVKLFPAKQSNDSVEHIDYCDYLSLTPIHSQLCTDCGRFFDRRKPHTCEHKVKPYSCYICGKRCVNEVALNFHSRIHNEDYEFNCKFCNVTFKLKADKFAHEQIHITQGKPYKCPDCLETFATNKERRIHLENHRGTIELKCRFCGVEFFRALSIQRHLLIHTGAKPYKCSVCQRGFNQSSHLKSHMRLHTGERPYKCQRCDKCFNHNVSLKNHIQRYHPVHSGPEAQTDTKINQKRDANSSKSDMFRKRISQDLDSDEEEQDTDSDAQITDDETRMEGFYRPKSRRRGTGRPIGRPKNFESNVVKTGKLNGKSQK
ncbi:zinc finger protein 436-like [Poeciliopsis prolifica]|uniref:zinc finger protein 436-like n=1 Tax=Poeciliopsis prolifica TaxID=188132 RepID=UPI002413BC22|nr:zinc finger protein 436-like [Poeciliopsis prolifica]